LIVLFDVSGLDALKDRRCGNGEAGKNVRINQGFIVLESLGSADGVEDSNYTSLRIRHPHRLRTVRKIEFNLGFQVRGLLRRHDFDGEFRRPLKHSGAPRHDSSGRKQADVGN
jgi:hypothetical protein